MHNSCILQIPNILRRWKKMFDFEVKKLFSRIWKNQQKSETRICVDPSYDSTRATNVHILMPKPTEVDIFVFKPSFWILARCKDLKFSLEFIKLYLIFTHFLSWEFYSAYFWLKIFLVAVGILKHFIIDLFLKACFQSRTCEFVSFDVKFKFKVIQNNSKHSFLSY